MGVVKTQSIKNTVSTLIGFVIGAINTLLLYTYFLGKDYYGITAFVLSSAQLLMPFMTFGLQNTMIKFFSTFTDQQTQTKFLNGMLLLPLGGILFWLLVIFLFQPQLLVFVGQTNPILKNFFWVIPLVGVFMAYFEIFYAWLKVHKESVQGNFIKEVVLRLMVSLGLFLVYLEVINPSEFVWLLVFIYALITLIIAVMALRIKQPDFTLGFKMQWQPILKYSLFIAFSSAIAILLLDIDKLMIGKYLDISQNAFYSVATFMAITISVPLRAMHQIIHPITSELIAKNNWIELNLLYKKSSITLQIFSGWIMLGIFVNLNQIYAILPSEYSLAMGVVFLISLSKFFDALLGNNNSIIYNSKYYAFVLWIGLGLIVLTVSLNLLLIPSYGLFGVGLATFISVFLYSFVKLMFVIYKMKLFPFTIKTIESLMIIIFCFLIFYFWDFAWHPVINILLKSVLLSIIYFCLIYFRKTSENINEIIDGVIKKYLKKP